MAQAAASSVNKEMEISMERLATGKRINGASDDAAGVAIASRLTSEIRSTNQAMRNAMDGQALIDTAEGAHQEVESILQRMRELAVQASNDTNDANDRANLQLEIDQLTTEIDRISSTTSWAGQSLLNGTGGTSSNGTYSFQVGSKTTSSDTISTSINSISSSALSLGLPSTSAALDSVIGVTKTGSETLVSDDVNSAAVKFGSTTFSTGVESVAGGSGAVITTTDAGGIIIETGAAAAGATVTVTLNGKDYSVVNASADDTGRAAASAALAGLIAADHTWATAAASAGTNTDHAITIGRGAMATDLVGQLNANADFTSKFTASVTNTNGVTVANKVEGPTLTEADGNLVVNSNTLAVTYSAGATYTFQVDGQSVSVTEATADSGFDADADGVAHQILAKITELGLKGFTATADNAGVITFTKNGSVDLTTQSNAQSAIDSIDAAIITINNQRATLGAVSNRLDNTVSNLTNISSNLQAGRGRIEDADFAAETTSLAKSQILQQASTAMLAQANASKQNVLSLLQG
jgi:flagellin